MHIPDGYLGPQTYIPAFVIMAPVWATASARVKRTLRVSQVPLMALGAAFCFVIMMFNVPIPGGTTGHAVGGALVAVLLGPWAAIIAVSLALVVQALVFGDGGITALGANCLNMAVILPVVGYWVYRLIAGRSEAASPRRWIGGALGGYVGLNAAALSAGVLFGIQPLLAVDGSGRPLYCPFGLKVAVPAMLGGHMLVFGVIEAVVTGLVLAYLQRVDISLFKNYVVGTRPLRAARGSILAPGSILSHYAVGTRPPRAARAPHLATRLAAGLFVLVLLSPLGVILPAKMTAGSAWGEWSRDEMRKIAGTVPAGMARMEGAWKAPLPNYGAPGQEGAPLRTVSAWYLGSGLLGAALLATLFLTFRKGISRKEGEDGVARLDATAP